MQTLSRPTHILDGFDGNLISALLMAEADRREALPQRPGVTADDMRRAAEACRDLARVFFSPDPGVGIRLHVNRH